MLLKGLQKTTLLDFPGKVACTVFTGGCNFRCPFCHNASLVINPHMGDKIDEEEFFAFLNKRKGVLDGVCITGGEPLLQKDIISFIVKIKALGFLVKLDTNGYCYDILEEILKQQIVDYIAMDIKNSPDKYAITAGIKEYSSNIQKSIELIMSSGIPYEFRTTVVRELHSEDDIYIMSRMIKGADKYFLQKFIDSGDLIGSGYSSYSEEEMKKLLLIARKWVENSYLRGV